MDTPLFRMQYIMPDGYPSADGRFDMEFVEIGASLKGVDRKWTNVPNTALSVKLNVMSGGTSLEIKKRGQMVYINLFCVALEDTDSVLATAAILSKQYQLGAVKRPRLENWIYSIPVAHALLRENEVVFCQKLTVSFFWAVYGQAWKRRNAMN